MPLKQEILIPNHRFNNWTFDKFLLVGDIGGTHLRLGILAIENNNPHLLFVNWYSTKQAQDISEQMNETLKYADEHYLLTTDTAILAAAGLLSKDKKSVRLTSNKLEISTSALLKKTLLKHVILMNDFEALGYGIPICKNVFQINQAKKSGENIAVIGAGTGLGVVLANNGNVVASEAGHLDLAVHTDEEYKIKAFLQQKGKQVDFDMLVSGSGLISLYEFYSGKKLSSSNRKASEITESVNKDSSAKKAVEMFVTFYGRFAGNIAKVNLPRGGLYLAGGVTTHIVSHMKSSFVREFEKTLPIADLKDEIPLYLINDHHLALLGCGMFYLKNPSGDQRAQMTEDAPAYKDLLL